MPAAPQSPRLSVSELSDRLARDHLEKVLGDFGLDGTRRGDQLARCILNGERRDSLVIDVAGPKRGRWYHFSAAKGGDVLDLIEYATGWRAEQVYDYARGLVGDGPAGAKSPPRTPKHGRRPEEKVDESREAKRLRAAGLWKEAGVLAGTLGEAYLRDVRGIEGVIWPASLRFHHGVYHDLERKIFPAILCFVRGADIGPQLGPFLGVWRIYLDPKTGGKAPVETPRLGLGQTQGGAVRLFKATPALRLCEGVETGLSLLASGYPAWACLSTSGLRGVRLPLSVTAPVIHQDNDAVQERRLPNGRLVRTQPGPDAAMAAAARFRKEGRTPRIACGPTGKDTNDLYQLPPVHDFEEGAAL